MKKFIISILLVGLFSCNDPYAEEINSELYQNQYISEFENNYKYEKLEVYHTDFGDDHPRQLIIYIVGMDSIPDSRSKITNISHNLSKSIYDQLKDLYSIEEVSFGFKRIIRSFLTYEKSGIDIYSYKVINDELIPNFPTAD